MITAMAARCLLTVAFAVAGLERRGGDGHEAGNARLGVQLLTQAAINQARRVTTAPRPLGPAAPGTVCADDIPGHLLPRDQPVYEHPGQYL
jgi:hypothetical protein